MGRFSQRIHRRLVVACLLFAAAAVFVTGIFWGLPSRRIERLLFGDRQTWPGDRIAALAPQRKPGAVRGADVDVNPIRQAAEPVDLNATDAQRAEIVRRYLLFSYQPDEMITMMSLASMRPGEGDFDPKLYQYGGLWIYPVGALLKAASAAGLVPLVNSPAYYLDHPAAFGRFYVVARLYTVAWGLVGAWAVFRIALQAGRDTLAAALATLIYMLMPVVVNMAHEAKPHLPGAVLILLGALAAGRFVQTGRRRWWVLAAAACGAAAGMVLSGILAMPLLVAMALMRDAPWRRRAGVATGSIAIALMVYAATNPYVIVHLLGDRSVLASNVGNTTAMYGGGRWWGGIANATSLLGEGATPLVAIAGVIGFVLAWRNGGPLLPSPALRLLIVVAALVLIPYFAFARDKPGEYGRFAALPDIVLGLGATVAVSRAARRTSERIQMTLLLVVLTALPTIIYLRGFVSDSGPAPRRWRDARFLSDLRRAGAGTLGVYAEPAPYSLPPVDLFRWRIVLLPRGYDLAARPLVDVIVRAVDVPQRQGTAAGDYVQAAPGEFDDLFAARISWANKPFEIWVRKEVLDRAR